MHTCHARVPRQTQSKEFLQALWAHKSTGSPDMKTSISGLFPSHLCLPLLRRLPPSSFHPVSVPQTFLQYVGCYQGWMEQQSFGNRSILFSNERRNFAVPWYCNSISLSLSPLPPEKWAFQQLLQVFFLTVKCEMHTLLCWPCAGRCQMKVHNHVLCVIVTKIQ